MGMYHQAQKVESSSLLLYVIPASHSVPRHLYPLVTLFETPRTGDAEITI